MCESKSSSGLSSTPGRVQEGLRPGLGIPRAGDPRAGGALSSCCSPRPQPCTSGMLKMGRVPVTPTGAVSGWGTHLLGVT